MKRSIVVGALFGWLVGAAAATAQVHVEYIAHACFVVESPAGVRVVIDPFESHRWLGYSFPDDVPADAVLVTHPHYDHDAAHYWSVETPVFRKSGRYAVGDVHFEGVVGKHAEPYGKEFGQLNTIWVVETGGIRIAHLGDNGPMDAATLSALGRVDVLMLPVDGDDHILKSAEIDAIRDALRPRITVPMHYRLEPLTELPRSLGPIEPWLEGRSGVERLETNRVRIEAGTDDAIFIFPHSPSVQAWPPTLHEAWKLRGEALDGAKGSGPSEELLTKLDRATGLAPDAVVFTYEWARMARDLGHSDEAMSRLERALASAGRDDRQYRMLARHLFGDLLAAAGREREAAQQYRLVLDGAYLTRLREAAARGLSGIEGGQ